MIVVDTSALMAIVLDGPDAGACIAALEQAVEVAISAGTLTEALIVARGRGRLDAVASIIDRLELEVVPLTEARARRVAEAHARWGRGHHRAALNFGDCFAYELARELDAPLLFVGADFAATDVRQAVRPSRFQE
jgi:ribonuclease VapC